MSAVGGSLTGWIFNSNSWCKIGEVYSFSTMNSQVILIRPRKWLSLVLLFYDINDSISATGAQPLVLVTATKQSVVVCFEHIVQVCSIFKKALFSKRETETLQLPSH
jgi:hypothetical protein